MWERNREIERVGVWFFLLCGCGFTLHCSFLSSRSAGGDDEKRREKTGGVGGMRDVDREIKTKGELTWLFIQVARR